VSLTALRGENGTAAGRLRADPLQSRKSVRGVAARLRSRPSGWPAAAGQAFSFLSNPAAATLFSLLVCCSVFADDGALSPENARKSFQLADPSLTIELVAAEPLVASPCALAWDEKGRMFVAENRGYPRSAQPSQGAVAMLEDTDGDGRMDRRTVFADGLTFPNGVLPWRGGLIVTCAPDVLFLKDTDGDGKADERRVLLTGFDTKGSTQLRVNAPTLGPDGWIYLAAGLSGGSVTVPEHPGRPALKMTADVRFHPDTLVVENVDGRSQYGMSFDEYGRRFICMNRLPVQHVVLSSKWLKRNPNLAFSDTVQDCNERSVKTGLRGGGDGVKLFPVSSNITTADSHAGSFSAACAIHVWHGGVLPEIYRGCALSCDPTGNLIHADKLTPRGATFAAESMFEGKEFLASRDDWFRPVYLARGPDGALYVADMYRKVIEHPDYLPEEVRKRTDFDSGKDKGRIWRIRAKSPVAATAVKSRAREFLGDFAKGTLHAEKLNTAWNSGDPGLRQLVLRAWLEVPAAREWKPDPAVLANETDAGVRFMAAIALGDIPEGTAALGQLAAQETRVEDPGPPLDRWTRAAVLSSVTGREIDFLSEFLGNSSRLTPEALEIVIGVGRCFPDLAALRKGLEQLQGGGAGRENIGRTIAALLLGVSERSRQPLRLPVEKDEWLTTVLRGFREGAEAKNAQPADRLLSIRIVGHMEWKEAGSVLLRLADTERDESLRLVVIRALAGFAEPDVARALLAAGKWASYSPAVREAVISALLGNSAHLAGVLEAIEAGQLPAAAIPNVRRNVYLKSKDAALKARAEKIWSAPPADRQKAFEAAKAALALKANPINGRTHFKNLCATCHRLDREGSELGPDLLDMRNQPKESILFHIVAPEAEVNVAYAPYLAETKDGRSLAGVLASESATSITLRMPLGQEETVLRANLAKLEALPGSLMPPGLEQAMSKQELADLLGYLKGE
jgi:putative membrane-bound dehydrogenase-like protein